MSEDETPGRGSGPSAGAAGAAGEEAVGSVGEEAVRLFGALADWARDHDLSQAGASVGERLRDLDEHVATGSTECTYCPVCRGIHFVRETSPEVRAHLASAASSLMQAAAGLLASAAADPRPPRSEGVERIDLDDDAHDPDDPDDPDGPPFGFQQGPR